MLTSDTTTDRLYSRTTLTNRTRGSYRGHRPGVDALGGPVLADGASRDRGGRQAAPVLVLDQVLGREMDAAHPQLSPPEGPLGDGGLDSQSPQPQFEALRVVERKFVEADGGPGFLFVGAVGESATTAHVTLFSGDHRCCGHRRTRGSPAEQKTRLLFTSNSFRVVFFFGKVAGRT